MGSVLIAEPGSGLTDLRASLRPFYEPRIALPAKPSIRLMGRSPTDHIRRLHLCSRSGSIMFETDHVELSHEQEEVTCALLRVLLNRVAK
jgi:hypothetical protein